MSWTETAEVIEWYLDKYDEVPMNFDVKSLRNWYKERMFKRKKE